MSIVSHKLSYSHDEVDELLSKIRAGKVLTDKDYEHLLKIGVTNLSTFSGNYDDLINKPDLRQVIMDILNENTIETTDSVQVKIQQLVASFNAHYQKIDNGLRKDMAVLEIELYEFLREAIIEQNEHLAALVEEWCVALAVDLENALNDKLIQHVLATTAAELRVDTDGKVYAFFKAVDLNKAGAAVEYKADKDLYGSVAKGTIYNLTSTDGIITKADSETWEPYRRYA